MNAWDSVAIVGVGLIGGSIGLGLRQRDLAKEVVGCGRRLSSLDRARRCGAVTRTTTDLADAVGRAQLVIVCTPVDRIADHVVEAMANAPADVVITDAGSVKGLIIERVTAGPSVSDRFVGSHPLAGSEKTGPENARADLFVDRTVVVTPTEHSAMDATASVERLWRELGARVKRMTADDHDRVVAVTSHLTHLVAAALAGTLDVEEGALVGTGWLDTVRIASGDPELWRQIVAMNTDSVLVALSRFENQLGRFRSALERGESAALMELLETGKRMRDALGS